MKREEKHNELNVSCLDAHWFKLMQEKEKKVKKIQHEHIKGMEQNHQIVSIFSKEVKFLAIEGLLRNRKRE